MSNSSPIVVVGVDVGGTKKGFHAVALRDGKFLERNSSKTAVGIAQWCWKMGAQAVGVDAPCRWSTDGRARPAERELMVQGIWCFSTPTRDAAISHPRNHFGWMLNGAELFQRLEQSYVLYGGKESGGAARVCFETFPQAVACALAGQVVSARKKASIRRELLREAGINISALTNIDFVDAGLCAVTALRLLAGQIDHYGNSETGFIVVPLKRG